MKKNVTRKTRRMIAFLLAAVMCVSLCTGFTANAQEAGGDTSQQTESKEQGGQGKEAEQTGNSLPEEDTKKETDTQDKEASETDSGKAGAADTEKDAAADTAGENGTGASKTYDEQQSLQDENGESTEVPETFQQADEMAATQEIAPLSASDLDNPRIEKDSSMEAGQKVTWDCVWFGSYPQAEVVPSADDYTAIDKNILRDGDILEDSSLYSKLQSATDWDVNNDTTVDGNAYRRMKKSDATFINTYSGYYNWADSEDYHYFKYEPIKWWVLKVNGDQAFLLSDIALDDQPYNTVEESITWEISTIRSWLNGYGALSNKQKKDYSGKSFIGSAFSKKEGSAIVNTSVVNDNNISEGTEGGNNTIDKIFLLSESETYEDGAPYGFVSSYLTYDEARRSKSSTYAKAMGTRNSTYETYKGNCEWWLRSPGGRTDLIAVVDSSGFVDSDVIYGYSVYNCRFVGVRAALNLDLSSNLYTYAGTVCSDGTVRENEGIVLQDKAGNTINKDSDEYKELQHLSFAKLAYSNFKETDLKRNVSRFVKQSKEYGEPIWKTSPIILKDFYTSFVGDWEIVDYENDNDNTGFAAVTFKKDNNVIIAYRGSENLELHIKWNGVSLGKDWDTDLQFAFWNKLSGQFDLANEYYERTVKKNPKAHISYTGHSLGGALAAYESILTGEKAYTYDSACGHIVDLAYMYGVDRIKNFTGLDKNNFTNYTDKTGYTVADLIQHTNMDGYSIVEYNTGENEVFGSDQFYEQKKFTLGTYSHSIWTCITPVGDKAVRFNDSVKTVPAKVWSKDILDIFWGTRLYAYYKKSLERGLAPYTGSGFFASASWLFRKGRVMLGTSGGDTIFAPSNWIVDNIYKANTNMYAGNGQDTLVGYSGNDILRSGKKGNKVLDGSGGNDLYIIENNPNAYIEVKIPEGIKFISFEGFDNLRKKDIQKIGSQTIRFGENQTLNIKSLSSKHSKVLVKLGDLFYDWEQLDGNGNGGSTGGRTTKTAAKTGGLETAVNVMTLEQEEAEFIHMMELDGVGTIEVLNSQGIVVGKFSNEQETVENVYEDYGFFNVYNNEDGQKLVAYVLDGYSMRVQGDKSVDIGMALISQQGIEEIDIAKDIELSSGDVIQRIEDDQLDISQQTENNKTDLNGLDKVLPVQQVSCSEMAVQLKPGESRQLQVTVIPDNATNRKISYEIEDPSIAEIDDKGKITAKKQGETEVTVMAEDGYNAATVVRIKVLGTTVPPKQESDSDALIKVSGITLTGISKKIAAGKKVKLTANITPSNAANKAVTWKSSNWKVAVVNKSGVVTMKNKSGGKSVTITAAAQDGSGVKATYKIKSMKGAVKKVAISGKKSVKAGKTLKLKAKVTAAKGANKKLKWTSSNKKYATVSGSGKVKALKAGKGKKVKITAMATDGSGKKKSVTIKIK